MVKLEVSEVFRPARPTVARLTQMGHEVVLFYLNDGGWPPTSSETRIAEAKKAREILKLARFTRASRTDMPLLTTLTTRISREKLKPKSPMQ